MKLLPILVFCLPLLAEDATITECSVNGHIGRTEGECNALFAPYQKLTDAVKAPVEQLQAQITAKDAEIAQLRQWGQACIAHVQKDMALINGFLGPLEQMPQPAIPTVARPTKPRESKP